MKSAILKPLLATLLLGASVSAKNLYHGYRVFRVDVDSYKQNRAAAEKLPVTLWTEPHEWESEGHVDVMVPPRSVREFESLGLSSEVMHKDLGQSIDDEWQPGVFFSSAAANDTWFNAYHSYDDHLRWLNDLQKTYPQNSEIVVAGQSDGGRDITGIHFWGKKGKNKNPAIVWHATVHAREWITAMTVEYMTYQLLSTAASDPEVQGFLDNNDFHIFPVVNPDGFVYTQTTDRLWRKTRQVNRNSRCVGTDVNRNWPIAWDVPGGSSPDPCSETYRGARPVSAPETVALKSYIDQLSEANGVKNYIDWHAYSQLFMTPYGYSCDKRIANDAEYQRLASGVGESIGDVYGTRYRTGPVCPTIYQTSGNSIDYAADGAMVDWTFAAELRDTGRYGFVLPASQIKPSGEETWAGMRYLLKNM